MLEYVPGEDLFYFLEKARDHEDEDGPELASPSKLNPQYRRRQGCSLDNESDCDCDDTETGDESMCESTESSETTGSGGATPPTPSLLAALDSSSLLSRRRLRLVGSMFAQVRVILFAPHFLPTFFRASLSLLMFWY